MEKVSMLLWIYECLQKRGKNSGDSKSVCYGTEPGSPKRIFENMIRVTGDAMVQPHQASSFPSK